MKLKLVFPLLMLGLLLVSYVLPVYADSGAVIPLGFDDSGYEAVPGYRIPVMLHAEAERNPVQYGFASSAIRVAGVEVGFDADPPGYGGLGSMKVYFYAKKGSEYVFKELIDSIGYAGGKKGYDEIVTIVLDCDGSLRIQTNYGAVTVKVDPGVSLDIYEQYGRVDSVTLHLASSVKYGEAEKIAECSNSGDNGDLPSPGDGSGSSTIGGDENDQFNQKLLEILTDKKIILGLIIVLILVLLRGILPW